MFAHGTNRLLQLFYFFNIFLKIFLPVHVEPYVGYLTVGAPIRGVPLGCLGGAPGLKCVRV